MQDVDRPDHIEPFPEPQRRRCARRQAKAFRFVLSSKRRGGICRDSRWWRHVGYGSTVGTPEAKLAIRPSIELISLLVDSAMVPATEQREVR
jgi:hypothetical protein